MSKWEMVQLGDVCSIVSGTTPKTTVSEYWNGTKDWITPAELKDDTYIIEQSERKITEKAVVDTSLRAFPAGTVILSSRAPIGKVAVAGKEMYCNQGFKNLICSEAILNYYLYWYLKSKTAYLNSLGRGATFKEISKSILERVEIPLPPLAEQQKIADTLDKVSHLIALRKSQLNKLDLLVNAKFVEMFGDPVENPMGWEKVALSTLAEVATGSTPNRQCTEYYGGNIPWIKTGEISQGYIDDAEEKLCNIAIKETNCKIFPRNTILIAMYGQGKTRGLSGVLKISAATNQACAAILPSENVNTEFLYRQFRIQYHELRTLGRGGNQENLNLSMVKAFSIILPPLPLQTQFANYVTQVETSKQQIQQGLEKLEILYRGLMQDYFDSEGGM